MADTFAIDQKTIEELVLQAVQNNILSAVESMSQDSAWLSRIEQLINQTVANETISKINNIDIQTIINKRIDVNMDQFRQKLLTNFSSIGISDQATQNQMTVMDDHTVFENNLTTRDLTVADYARIQNLVVTGSINTDNLAWSELSEDITNKTFARLTAEWQDQLVKQVAEQIKEQGIDFDQITVDGLKLVDGNRLSEGVKETSIQTTGVLRSLRVAGHTQLNNTLSVVTKRVGINTEEPEMALSVWDEEISINIGKHKEKIAFIGTSRDQGLAIGTNRIPQIEIDADGMTQIKKLRIGVHQISHSNTVPGWAGTRGDLVFNTNPVDNVFAWVCLGNFKWKLIKSAE